MLMVEIAYRQKPFDCLTRLCRSQPRVKADLSQTHYQQIAQRLASVPIQCERDIQITVHSTIKSILDGLIMARELVKLEFTTGFTFASKVRRPSSMR